MHKLCSQPPRSTPNSSHEKTAQHFHVKSREKQLKQLHTHFVMHSIHPKSYPIKKPCCRTTIISQLYFAVYRVNHNMWVISNQQAKITNHWAFCHRLRANIRDRVRSSADRWRRNECERPNPCTMHCQTVLQLNRNQHYDEIRTQAQLSISLAALNFAT